IGVPAIQRAGQEIEDLLDLRLGDRQGAVDNPAHPVVIPGSEKPRDHPARVGPQLQRQPCDLDSHRGTMPLKPGVEGAPPRPIPTGIIANIQSDGTIPTSPFPWKDSRAISVIWYKRLESGTFQQLDPQAHVRCISGSGIELTVTELARLLTGIDLTTA